MHPDGPMTDGKRTTYTGTLGGPLGEGGLVALGPRLAELKRWVAWDAGISVHSAVCVVNGKATVATHNAPYADAQDTQPGRLADGTPIGQGPRDGAGGWRGRGGGAPRTAPRTRGCISSSLSARRTRWRCPSRPVRWSPGPCGGVGCQPDASRVELACVRLAGGDGGAARRTTGSGARSRPPPRQSVCRP